MHAALGTLFALALPPRCPGCGCVTAADHRFCAGCWSSLHFIAPPWCAACNLPFDHDRGEGMVCGACIARPPRHAGVRAAVAYGPVARNVALRLKYAGRTAFAETAARLMARHLPGDTDLILSVPLHRRRLWSRSYNQAALIATALGRIGGVRSDARLLERTKPTPVLRGLNPSERRRAVRGVFGLATGGAGAVKGRAIVLADDVYTSGATADACTHALLRAGAASVTILCWARVLPDGDGLSTAD
ncbi:ComF family protein [Sphingomonas sp. SUN019]|uniref:ComF family protein n=1 Tax=Sphingomonas sp. SUN019 TaxID=2937788 RepID=UPI0021642587|nr:ComF family protein [Sphingomonas sp. SUN019]UVO52558.1 ComF family protein [Sphingomonas sp. SUN019]